MFLLKNGYMAVANIYFREMENISYHVAAGHIDEDLFRRILAAILTCTYDSDEELKLDIFNAISVEDVFYSLECNHAPAGVNLYKGEKISIVVKTISPSGCTHCIILSNLIRKSRYHCCLQKTMVAICMN